MKIISAIKLPNRDKWLFVEALFFIAVARIAIRFFSFKKLMNYLGTPQKELPINELSQEERQYFKRIRRAVRMAARNSFWHTMCYEQALTAKLMLRRRNHPSTIYIGIRKSEEKGMEGHAWIRNGDYIITGDTELDTYTIVGIFS